MHSFHHHFNSMAVFITWCCKVNAPYGDNVLLIVANKNTQTEEIYFLHNYSDQVRSDELHWILGVQQNLLWRGNLFLQHILNSRNEKLTQPPQKNKLDFESKDVWINCIFMESFHACWQSRKTASITKWTRATFNNLIFFPVLWWK